MVNSRQKLEISPEKWNHRVRVNGVRPNRRLQLTAFGARDRCFFDVVLCRAPRRQLKRNTLGGFHHSPAYLMTWYNDIRRKVDRTRKRVGR